MKAIEAGPTYGNYIDGAWTEARGGSTYATVNPARPSERIGQFQRSTRRAAPGGLDPEGAGGGVRRDHHSGDGKTIADARGEGKRALNVLEFMAGEGRRDHRGSHRPGERTASARSVVRDS